MRLWPLLFFSFPAVGWGAACCGGGFAAPSIIAGDDKAQIAASSSFSEVVVDNVDSKGIWRTGEVHQQVRTFRLEGAHLLSDRWQIGGTVPVIRRSLQSESYAGLGDVSASLAYEYLPDWDYNPIRPKGIGYFQLTLPTGKSRFDSEVGGLDSRGNGFWAVGLGTLLTKAIGRWDAFSSFEIHRSFEKRIETSHVSGTLSPGVGGTLGLGGGCNTAFWRFGGSIVWTSEDPIPLRGASNIEGFVERYATGVFSVSYLANEAWSGTLSYADQTLFGDPVNTSLGRTIALQVQRRWGR